MNVAYVVSHTVVCGHNQIRKLQRNKYKTLWISDKTTICTKFVSSGLPLVRVEEKFLFYTNIVDCMDATKRHHDIGPIRINLDSLINSVRAHAIEWKNTLGKLLSDETKTNIKHLYDQMIVSFEDPESLHIANCEFD